MLSVEQLSLLGQFDTAWARRNAIDYWLDPSFGGYAWTQFSIAISQYTNPELVLAGATAMSAPIPRGYKSFAEFKKVYGSAGSGMA